MKSQNKLDVIRKAIRKVASYPTKKQGRRTDDGYSEEMVYDEFAYKRMVDSYRIALKKILKEFK